MLNLLRKKIASALQLKCENKLKYAATKIAVIYFVLGLIWVFLSDGILNKFSNDNGLIKTIQIYKACFFVVITSIILYIVIKNVLKKYVISETKLNDSFEELTSVYEELEEKNQQLIASEEELRKQVEKLNVVNLRNLENESRLKRASKIASVGNWEYDIINKTIWVSVEARQIYGFLVASSLLPVEAVQGSVISEDRYKVDTALRYLIYEDKNCDLEYRIIRIDNGDVRNIHAIAETQCDFQGNPVKVLGVIQDVTKRVQYEKKLIENLEELNLKSSMLYDSERRLKKAQAIGHVGNWEYNFQTKVLWGSEEGHRLFWSHSIDGSMPIEYVYKHFDPKYLIKLDNAMKNLLEYNKEYNMEYRIINTETGEERYIHSIAELEYDKENKPARILGIVKDITSSKYYELNLKNSNEELSALYEQLAASEEELRQQLDEILMNRNLLQVSEERYKTLVDNSQDLIFSCDCNSVFIAVNKRFCQIISLPPNEIIGRKMSDIFHNSDLNRDWNEAITRVIKNKEVVHDENRYVEGTIFNITICPIFDINNNVIGVTATNNDVTESKKSEETIRHMAYYDDLTDLPNRIFFINELTENIEKADKYNTKLVILFIDMDNFKKVNDTLGHAYGDDFLRECAKRLQFCVKENDFPARLSGDEFSVILRDVMEVEDSLPTINRILQVFQEPFYIGNNIINMSASIGVAVFPQDGNYAEDLLRSADTAMYKAKEMGKNGYQFFNVNMKNELINKLNIEVMLRKAISKNELFLYYQPQFHAKMEKLRGVEALIRWKSSELGFMSPAEFIPIAEETGLIAIIGEWVLNKACVFGKKINDQYGSDIIIAVNISPLQLKHSNFYNMVINAVIRSGINPANLELEVTENIFIDNFEFAVKILNDLKQYGIRIALDDFGTGYSSLSYLKKLPINLLKIDKSFIDEIDISNPKNDFADSIISLVHKLDIEALAEGVENQFQYEYLVNADIDNIQGFYLGKPLPEEEIEKILASSKEK